MQEKLRIAVRRQGTLKRELQGACRARVRVLGYVSAIRSQRHDLLHGVRSEACAVRAVLEGGCMKDGILLTPLGNAAVGKAVCGAVLGSTS